jgi:hypothetical protein
MIAWPIYAAMRGLTVRRYHGWIYWDTGDGLPPRINRLTRVRLPSSFIPVDDWAWTLTHDRPTGLSDRPGSSD